MREILLSALLLIAANQLAHSQNFEPGCLVLQRGDTLRGEVENAFWESPAKTVRFRATLCTRSAALPRSRPELQLPGPHRQRPPLRGRLFLRLHLPALEPGPQLPPQRQPQRAAPAGEIRTQAPWHGGALSAGLNPREAQSGGAATFSAASPAAQRWAYPGRRSAGRL